MTRWAAEDGWPYPDALGDIVEVGGEADDDLVMVRTDAHLFDSLDPIEREVVAARFGLRGHAVRSIQQLHGDLGLPSSDLQLALGSGLAKLRTHLSGCTPPASFAAHPRHPTRIEGTLPMPYPENVSAPYWMSIEVFDGTTSSASSWAEAWGDRLVENALLSGAVDWNWHRSSWGVIFEVAFSDEGAWERYRDSLGVTVALDAVPDPVSGIIVYRGRGGSSGASKPRRPRPLIGSGAAALPLPEEAGWFLGSGSQGHVEPLRVASFA
jgi:hypothetical protein